VVARQRRKGDRNPTGRNKMKTKIGRELQQLGAHARIAKSLYRGGMRTSHGSRIREGIKPKDTATWSLRGPQERSTTQGVEVVYTSKRNTVKIVRRPSDRIPACARQSLFQEKLRGGGSNFPRGGCNRTRLTTGAGGEKRGPEGGGWNGFRVWTGAEGK